MISTDENAIVSCNVSEISHHAKTLCQFWLVFFLWLDSATEKKENKISNLFQDLLSFLFCFYFDLHCTAGDNSMINFLEPQFQVPFRIPINFIDLNFSVQPQQ